MDKEQIEEGILYAESVFGRQTRQGLVRISHGITFEIIVSPEEARFFAMTVLEAAQAAETDEILMTWLAATCGVKDEQNLAAILADFRNIRVEMRKRELEEARKHGTENKL